MPETEIGTWTKALYMDHSSKVSIKNQIILFSFFLRIKGGKYLGYFLPVTDSQSVVNGFVHQNHLVGLLTYAALSPTAAQSLEVGPRVLHFEELP